MEKLLTPQQVAETLDVKVSTIYQWTHQEFIPHIKIGRFVRFRISEIERWLDERKVAGRATRRVQMSRGEIP